MQRVSCRGLLGNRHAQDAGRDRGIRDPPGDDLDVTGQLITVGDLQLGVVSDRQGAGPGEHIVHGGRQAAPGARGERHRVREAAGERAGRGGQVVLGQRRLAAKGPGEGIPAGVDLDGRAQRPRRFSAWWRASVRRCRLTAGPAMVANTQPHTSRASANVPPAAAPTPQPRPRCPRALPILRLSSPDPAGGSLTRESVALLCLIQKFAVFSRQALASARSGTTR